MNLKFKRSWLILLSFVLMLGILAACSGGSDNTSTEGEKENEEKETGPQMGGTVVGAMDTAPSGASIQFSMKKPMRQTLLNLCMKD